MSDTSQSEPSFGAGRGGGRGAGRRRRRQCRVTGLTGWQRAQTGEPGPSAALPPAIFNELAALKQQVESLEQTLGELKSRILELDKPTPDMA